MDSIWSKTIDIESRPALPGDMAAEAAVIGGGLAGVLTAFYLSKRGVKTVVLEAARIGSGQTKNTTAKITSQHGLIYAKLIKNFGADKAKHYAEANRLAIEEYRRIIEELGIDCSFAECSAYLYSTQWEQEAKLKEEAFAAKNLGLDAEFTLETELPFSVAGAVKFSGQAVFHPLAFLKAVSKNLDIYERTKVTEVKDGKIVTERGVVTAKHVIFASHFPFTNMPGFYFARMHQERSYVMALENVAKLDGMYLGIDEGGLSFRRHDNVLMLGGGGHRTGENSAGGKYAYLREKARELYPNSVETARWSAQDCMTLDGVPYISEFAPSAHGWYVATGFNKWGMTGSMVSAILLSDKITGVENPLADVFSPSRFAPAASIKTFFSDMGQSVKGLSRQLFSIPKSSLDELPAGHGGIIEHGGKKIGAYKDEDQKVYLVSTRCPHLGCRLEWNPDEKSWDCPCHGSRFDYAGNLIDNPAQTGLESRHIE